MSLSNLNFENSTVVASALVAEIRQTRPAQTRVPHTGVQVQALPSAQSDVRVVGETVYHSWLLPLSSGFESRATHPGHAPLAELG
jgi:hypothetical protein